jgi:PGF-pre-PGF domain-containing protein
MKKIFLIVLCLIVLSSVGFSAACELEANYTQGDHNSTCDLIHTNGYTWDTAGYNLITTGNVSVGDGGVFQGRTGDHDIDHLLISSGGVFNSTSGNLTLLGLSTISGKVFDNDNGASGFIHNDGIVITNSTGHMKFYTGSATFYDVECRQDNRVCYIWDEPMTVINSFNNTGVGISYIDHLRDGGSLTIGNASQSGVISTNSLGMFRISGTNSIQAASSDYPVVAVGADWAFMTATADTVTLSGINFTTTNITIDGLATQLNIEDDCWFSNVSIGANDTFNISSGANVEFLSDLVYVGDMTLEGNITSLGGVINVTGNTTVNGLLNVSQGTGAYFGNLTLNTNGVYHATSLVTTIYDLINVYDSDRIVNNSGTILHSPSADVNLNYTNSSLYFLNLTAKNYTAVSDIFVKYLKINSGTNLSIGSGVTVYYCDLLGLGTTGGLGSISGYCSDSSAPIVTIESPDNNSYYGYTDAVTVSFNVSKETDSSVDCNLFIDDTGYGVANEVFNASSTSIITNVSVPVGVYDWYVNCTDSASNVGKSEVRRMEIVDHNLTYVSPTPDNSSETTNYNIIINVSIYESALGEIKFNWNGTNTTLYDNDLILFYNFDNDSALGENNTHVVDVSMQSNNGTVSGGSVGLDGKYGGAYCSDGSSSNIILGDVEELKLTDTDFTIALWLNINSSETMHLIGRELDWILQISGYEYSFLINGTANTSTGGEYSSFNKWAHVVVTHTDATNETNFYFNGDYDSTEIQRDIVTTTTTDGIIIGADARNGAQYELSGCMDGIRVWNRSLTASEIRQQYYSNVKKYSATTWGVYVNQSFAPYMRNVSGNYSYNTYLLNLTQEVNSTGEMSIQKSLPTITPLSTSVCHYKDCKEAVMIISGDANVYSLYSTMYKAFENNSNYTGKNYVYTFDIDTKCYREGGGCSNGGQAPADIEIKELFWEGHCIDFDGYTHNGSNQYPFDSDATGNATHLADVLEAYLNGSEAIYYNLTGVPVITGFLPWSNNHRSMNHGEIGFENASFVALKSLYDDGHYYYDLVVPETAENSYLSVGTNSRDDYDFYEQAGIIYNRGYRYSHVFGHSSTTYSSLVSNLTAFSENTTLNNYFWSASFEQAARYIVERDNTVITEDDLSGVLKQITLTTTYPSTLDETKYGVDIYVMPLTIKIADSSDNSYVYENDSGTLTRLYSYTNGTDLLFDVVPKNQSILMSTTSLQTADSPFINVTVSYLDVTNTTGSSVRGGGVYEVVVNANDSNSEYTNWTLTVVNSTNQSYETWFNVSVNDTDLDVNDRLTNERGKILYYLEKGYTNASLFTFEGNLTNADGDSRYLKLEDVNGTVSFGMVNSTTANVSTDVSDNITVEMDGFVERNFTVYLYNSTGGELYNFNSETDSTGMINFSSDLSVVSQVSYIPMTANGGSCSAASECNFGYCVNDYCRSDSFYCGDSVCDTGESCSSCAGDCGVCVTTTNDLEMQCADRKDNDNDGLVDLNDPGCSGRNDNDESDDVTDLVRRVNESQERIKDNSEKINKIIEKIKEEKKYIVEILKNVVKGEEIFVDVLSKNDRTDETKTSDALVVSGLNIVPSDDYEEVNVEIIEIESGSDGFEEFIVIDEMVSDDVGRVDISRRSYDVHSYVSLETEMEIESATFKFEVSKEWMEMQGAVKDDVVLLHFVNDSWVELETVYLEGDDPLLFEAQTKSFSVFAVGVKVEETLDNNGFPYFMVVLILVVGVGLFVRGIFGNDAKKSRKRVKMGKRKK